MKPALYHTVRKDPYGFKYEAMTVTSEKGSRLYGRDEHGLPTNAARRDTFGRLDTFEKAQAFTKQVDAVKAEFAKLRGPHEAAIMSLHRQERAKIEELLKTVNA